MEQQKKNLLSPDKTSGQQKEKREGEQKERPKSEEHAHREGLGVQQIKKSKHLTETK